MVGRKRKRLKIEPLHTLQIVPFPLKPGKPVMVTPEELEALRLVDYLGLSQEDAARKMGCSRATVSRLLRSARKKIATGVVEGRVVMKVS